MGLSDSTDRDLSPQIREVASPLPGRIKPLAPQCQFVQFSKGMTGGDLRQLASFLHDYPDVTLRAYGDYDGSISNLDWLQHFPSLRRLQVDALYNLQSLAGLEHLPSDLVYLGLGQTRKRFSLAPLRRFSGLRAMYLEGHTQDIEVLSDLSALVDLTLRSITLPDLSLLLPLRHLRALDLKLGGTTELGLLPELAPLRYLELWQVRGLSDISSIGEMDALEELFLQSLRNVTVLPDLSSSRSLRYMHLVTMKGLSDLRPLRHAPALEQLQLFDMPRLQPDDLRPLVDHPTLTAASVALGSMKKDRQAKDLLGLPRAYWSSVRAVD